MKQSIIRAILFATAVACSGVAFAGAQPPSQAPASDASVDQAIEQLRKDVRTEVNALIGGNMQFTSEEASKFWPLYKAYEERRKPLADERLAIIKDYAQNFTAMTDAKAAELMQRALALEEKMAAAKRGFLADLSKALPAKTVARFYQVHNRIDLLVNLSLAQEIPLAR